MNLWIQIQVVCPKVEKLPRPGRKMLIVIAIVIKVADLIFKLEKSKGGEVAEAGQEDAEEEAEQAGRVERGGCQVGTTKTKTNKNTNTIFRNLIHFHPFSSTSL